MGDKKRKFEKAMFNAFKYQERNIKNTDYIRSRTTAVYSDKERKRYNRQLLLKILNVVFHVDLRCCPSTWVCVAVHETGVFSSTVVVSSGRLVATSEKLARPLKRPKTIL